jgi:hypothetical protein
MMKKEKTIQRKERKEDLASKEKYTAKSDYLNKKPVSCFGSVLKKSGFLPNL